MSAIAVGGFNSALEINSFKGADGNAQQGKRGNKNARGMVDSLGSEVIDLTGSVGSGRKLNKGKSRMDHVDFCAPKPVFPKNPGTEFLVDFQGQKKLICVQEDTKKPVKAKIGFGWEVTAMAKQGLIGWVSSLNLNPTMKPNTSQYPWIEDLRMVCYSLFHNLGEFYDIFTLNFNVTPQKSPITKHRSFPKNYSRRSKKSPWTTRDQSTRS